MHEDSINESVDNLHKALLAFPWPDLHLIGLYLAFWPQLAFYSHPTSFSLCLYIQFLINLLMPEGLQIIQHGWNLNLF